jgi:hypothetical protein
VAITVWRRVSHGAMVRAACPPNAVRGGHAAEDAIKTCERCPGTSRAVRNADACARPTTNVSQGMIKGYIIMEGLAMKRHGLKAFREVKMYPLCPKLDKCCQLPRSATLLSPLRLSPVPRFSYARADADCSSVVAHGTVDDSTRGACGARRPVRQTGGSRQGRACHLFRDGRDVQHVRQTLSDVSAHIGDAEWGFPDI